MRKLPLYLSSLLLLSCAKDSSEDKSSLYVTPPSGTTNITPSVTQYTLSVTAGEGGSVSSEGGEYEEGTEVTITATPDQGYEFTGWSDGSTNQQITIVSLMQFKIVPSPSEKHFKRKRAIIIYCNFIVTSNFLRERKE